MAASLVSHNALGEQLSVVLIPKVAGDLRRLKRRTRLSSTDLANRAITSYEFFDTQLRAGRDVIVRDSGTGETRLVRFLSVPAQQPGQARHARQARRAWPRLLRWGRRLAADARWPEAYIPTSAGELGWPADERADDQAGDQANDQAGERADEQQDDRQDPLSLAGLVGQGAGTS